MSESGAAALERRIYFFRGVVENVGQQAKLQPVDVGTAVNTIFGSNDFYLDIGNDTQLCAWNQSNQTHTRIAFGAIRRSGLPQIELRGKIRSLEILEDEGLVDLSHIVVFDDGVVGQEFNNQGPRIGRFAEYLMRKHPVIGLVEFQMLFKSDVWEQMSRIGEVHLVRLRIVKEYLPQLFGHDEGVSVLEEMADVAGSPEVELVFRRARYSKRNLLGRPKELVERFFAFARSHPDGVKELDVRGLNDATERVETFDFLRNRLIGTRRVARQQSQGRGVDSEAMFEAIISARQELEAELAHALVVQEPK